MTNSNKTTQAAHNSAFRAHWLQVLDFGVCAQTAKVMPWPGPSYPTTFIAMP